MKIIVNLAGNFGLKSINSEVSIELKKNANVEELLKALHRLLKIKIFSVNGMKSNFIVVMINGERIAPKFAKNRNICESDYISIVQPIQGG
ncbi:MoaD/ThiS family protein [Candidatus Harpocratesius sp.]